MRLLIQRVKQVRVEVGGKTVSAIGNGLLVFVGICDTDTDADIDYLSSKLVNMRIFDDEQGTMNLSALDTDANILIVSQFTLYAQTRRGNRPSYILASKPEVAEPVYDRFCREVESKIGRPIFRGIFGADMQVSLTNDGPVTIWIDSSEKNN